MKIQTAYYPPPIPLRDFDWSAVDADVYDGPPCPIGWGRTEAAAIRDLLEQLPDDDDQGHTFTDCLIDAVPVSSGGLSL